MTRILAHRQAECNHALPRIQLALPGPALLSAGARSANVARHPDPNNFIAFVRREYREWPLYLVPCPFISCLYLARTLPHCILVSKDADLLAISGVAVENWAL